MPNSTTFAESPTIRAFFEEANRSHVPTGANLSQLITAGFNAVLTAKYYGQIRAWLEADGDPFLLEVMNGETDSLWAEAVAECPVLELLCRAFGQAKVWAAVQMEAACILKRRMADAERKCQQPAWARLLDELPAV